MDAAFERCRAEPGLLARGPDFVLYLLHDAISDLHFALVDHLSDEAEALAEEVTSGQAGGQRGRADHDGPPRSTP